LTTASRVTGFFAVAGLVLALVSAALAALSGVLYRFQWLSLGDAFMVLRWAAYGGAAAMALCIPGLFRVRPRGGFKGPWPALAGLVIAAVVFWVPYSHLRRAHDVPPIHDITTDTVNPPAFRAVLPLRGQDANSLEYGGEALAGRQRRAYPGIRPLELSASYREVFDAALATARDMDWRVIEAARDAGRIEAVDTTFWFGFRDDIVVRIRETGGATRVDVRSVSRVGVSDVGKNAERIERFSRALASRLR
jgi:hypothetical protein